MSSNALFASSIGRNQQKNLIEFKAGKMHVIVNTVHADTRKGLIYIHQTEDGLMHFCWKNRTNGVVGDDLIIFQDDCEFKRVPQCTTGRVYILKFKSSTRKLFYWLQDLKTDKDEDIAKRVNDLLNGPRTSNNGGSQDNDLQNLLSNMNQQQLMHLFGNVGQMGNITSLLGNLSRPPPPSTRGSTTGQVTMRFSSPNRPLATVVTAANADATADATSSSDIDTFDDASDTESNTTSSATASATPSSSKVTVSSLKKFPDVDFSGTVTVETLQLLFNHPELISKGKENSKTLSKSYEQAFQLYEQAKASSELKSVKEFKSTSEAVEAIKSGNKDEFLKAILKAEGGQNEQAKQAEKRKTSDEEESGVKRKDKNEENTEM